MNKQEDAAGKSTKILPEAIKIATTSDIQGDGSKHGIVRVGPAGWSYTDWTGSVYPRKKPAGFHEAAYLAEYFDTIEINTSFYQQPVRPDHCELWLTGYVAANPRFQFTAKLWQRFTHETGSE